MSRTIELARNINEYLGEENGVFIDGPREPSWGTSGFQISATEAERIAERTTDAAEFLKIWENQTWWLDADRS